MGFRSSGLWAEVAAQAPDRIEAGQVLARSDDADARNQAGANWRPAEIKLTDLTAADPAATAAARASLSAAQAELPIAPTVIPDLQTTAGRPRCAGNRPTIVRLTGLPDAHCPTHLQPLVPMSMGLT